MLRHSYLCLFVLLMCVSSAHAQQTPLAFPTAEGFGKFAQGGRGGRVIEVTNLNCSGPGSFREAVEASGTRTVVFRTGGTIDCSTEDLIRIDDPFITIAGQTAPGGGILLKGTGLWINTHDVILRYMRLRLGADFLITSDQHPDSAFVLGVVNRGDAVMHDVIIDHVSISWGSDDSVQLWDTTDITVQWSIIAEGVNCGRKKSCHGKGMLSGFRKLPMQYSIHHNLFSNTPDRNPNLALGSVDVINNVHHNVVLATQIYPFWAPIKANIIGNIITTGPNTPDHAPIRLIGGLDNNNPAVHIPNSLVYAKGNVDSKVRPNNSLPEGKIILFSSGPPHIATTTTRIPTVTYPSETDAFQAKTDVLADVGDNKRLNANGSFTARRGIVDERIINEVIQGKGKYIVDTPDEVGGFPSLNSGAPYADTDKDGMSDIWEERFGFTKADATDRNLDTDGDGYTNLEEFLNGTGPGSANNNSRPEPPQNVRVNISP